MTNPARDLIGGYVFGTLTSDEERQLLRAALDDQEIFDALGEDAPLRGDLADPEVRRELLALLEKPTLGDRLRAFIRRPATWADLSLAAAAMLVAVVLVRVYWAAPTPRLREAAQVVAVHERLFELPPRVVIPAALEVVEVPRAGLPGKLAVQVEAEATVLVLERRADGPIVSLYPGTEREARIDLGQRVVVPTLAGRLPVRFRLAVFPADVNPLSLDLGALRALEGRLTLVEREVAAGGPTR